VAATGHLEVAKTDGKRTPPASNRADASTAAVVRFVFGGTLWLWSLLVIVPLLFAVLTSLKANNEIFASPLRWPKTLRWNNYARAWTKADIGRYLGNTLFVVGLAVILTLLLSSMVAYILARYSFRGSRIVYYLFILGLVFPLFLAIVPLFFVAKDLHLNNSLIGLALIYAAYSMPFSVFFLTAFFKTLPNELAESASIDGAGHWRTFLQIMLPLARPGLVSVGIFNVLGLWNQYLLPIVLINDDKKFVLTQGLANLAVQERSGSDYGALFAALIISIAPVVAVYVAFHRQVRSGMTAGSLR
jgi:N-acetylglucosamine transport system permease protein